MEDNKAHTYEEIFAEMHRELRTWNRDIPESPDRLDPILRIMMQMHAHQLSRLDQRIDIVWDKAKESLIRTVCPESMRWPVPAITVMSCVPEDAAITVDPHTRFFYKEQREGSQTFFFTAMRNEKILSAATKYIFLKKQNDFLDMQDLALSDTMSGLAGSLEAKLDGTERVYVAVDYEGNLSNFNGAAIFLKGNPDVLKQLQWGTWYPGSNFGAFHEDSGFCPGKNNALESMFSPTGFHADWGSLRSTADLFPSLINSFVRLPEQFVSTWEVGPIDEPLMKFLQRKNHPLATESGNLYWMRIDLPVKGDKRKFIDGLELLFNCFVVANKNELTLFKHTGGYRIVEVELPDDLKTILEINRVIDSNGREYKIRHQSTNRNEGIYSLEERENRLVLWFDYTDEIDRPPDSLTVHYSVTAGTDANGIDAGEITELYESHPGVVEAKSVLPTSGAIPAKSTDQVATEVAARLRNRDRALSFTEISNWTTAFDPRIKKVECSNAVERAERGIRRCIRIDVKVDGEKFYSDAETGLLSARLGHYLKSRVPVNTHFSIKIVTK